MTEITSGGPAPAIVFDQHRAWLLPLIARCPHSYAFAVNLRFRSRHLPWPRAQTITFWLGTGYAVSPHCDRVAGGNKRETPDKCIARRPFDNSRLTAPQTTRGPDRK
jgi:hypothetical protein